MGRHRKIDASDLGNVFNSSLELVAAAIALLSRVKSTRIESDTDGNVVALANVGTPAALPGCKWVGTYRYASQRAVRNDLIELLHDLAAAEEADLDRQARAIA